MFNKYTVKDYYEKLDKLSPEMKRLLNDLYKCPDSEEYQLSVIKRKRPKLRTGDVFLVNLFKDIYFYGLVLNAEPNGNHTAIGKNVADICIFSDHIKGLYEGNEPPKFKQENVLVLPAIVSRSCWTSGYFYNVGNIGDNREFEYAFFHTSKDIFVNCKGEPITELPDIVGMNAFTTLTGIATSIYQGVFLNMDILSGEERALFLDHVNGLINYEPPEPELSDFQKSVLPFGFYEEHKRRYSIILCEFEQFEKGFFDRSNELTGSGCDWEDLMKYFVKVNFSESKKKFHYDSEAGMFYMYCSDEELLKAVVLKLKEVIDKGELQRYIMEADFSDLE